MGVEKSTFAFSKTSVILDQDSTTINITRDNQSYSHKLAHDFGDIVTLPVGTADYTWTPTHNDLEQFLEEIPNQTSRVIDVYLYTYNGATLVGKDTQRLTINTKEAVAKPNMSVSVSDVFDHVATYGGLVSNKSKLTVNITASGKYGATIDSYRGQFCGQSVTDSQETFTAVNTNDQAIIDSLMLSARDSRSYSTDYSTEQTIYPYQNPELRNIDVIRCLEDGSPSASGTYAKVSVSYFISDINNENSKSLSITSKESIESEYTNEPIVITLDEYEAVKTTIIGGFATDTSYSFLVELTDDFDTTTDDFNMSVTGTVVEFASDGNSIIIGNHNANNILIDEDSISFRCGSEVSASLTPGQSDVDNYSPMNLSIGHGSETLELYSKTAVEQEIDTSTTDLGISVSGVDGFGVTKQAKVETRLIGVLDGAETPPIQLYSSEINLEADKISIPGCSDLSSQIKKTRGDVHLSGDCNTLIETGTYFIGASGANKPETVNGWLESMLYSTNYCYQKYTTYTGRSYERTNQGGTWSKWKNIHSFDFSIATPNWSIINAGYAASGYVWQMGKFCMFRGCFTTGYLNVNTYLFSVPSKFAPASNVFGGIFIGKRHTETYRQSWRACQIDTNGRIYQTFNSDGQNAIEWEGDMTLCWEYKGV